MSLILIPGHSGSGKSRMLFRKILDEAAADPGMNFIVLVPEQNTLQTQKTLVSMSDAGGIWNIDVLSFTRLAYRVFERCGVSSGQVLSETGKILLLRLIAAREGEKIPILSGIVDRPGSLSEIKSILSELDQYGIGREELSAMESLAKKGGKHPALAGKLSEIALLQEAYGRYQEGHFITGEKLPRVLSEKVPSDAALKGCVVCLDSFTGLTPAQLQVITAMLPVVKDVYVTVTIDPEVFLPDPGLCSGGGAESENAAPGPEGFELTDGMIMSILAAGLPDYELFSLSLRTIQSLIRCALMAGKKVRVLPVEGGGETRYAPGGELEHLQRHFLRSGSEGIRPYTGKGAQEIFLRQCSDPWDEAVSAAVTIEELIRRGLKYREIAIVCGSLKDYSEYVRRVMSLYGIPCYIDRSQAVVMNPAFEFVRCAIDIAEKNFSYESIMALMRTSLALGTASGSVDRLENYLLAAGIRGRRMWSEPFSRKTRDDDQALLSSAEASRSEFMERFGPFAEAMKSSRACFSHYAEAVWELIIAFDVPSKLQKMSERCFEEGRDERAQEYAQVTGVISSVLDEAVSLMGEETVTRAQFSDILAAGFSEAKIGILPRGIDQVQVADLERSRLENIKVVFFLGMNDGFVPPGKAAGGVLTDLEREYLRAGNIHMAPTAREEAGIQRFYLYLTLTKPSHALYLSWSAFTRGRETLRPSGVLRSINLMFPSAGREKAASEAPFDSVASLRYGKRVLSGALGDYLYSDSMAAVSYEPMLMELINLYRRYDAGGSMSFDEELRSIVHSDSLKAIDKETAKRLYGLMMTGSVTRLETFSDCAFRHFAMYGLKLKEREEFSIRALDTGNLLHRAIEIFSRKLGDKDSPYTWRTLTDEERDRLALAALDEAVESQHAGELFNDTFRSAQVLKRCGRVMLRSVKTIQRQIMAGAFEPELFELSFGSAGRNSVTIEDLPGGGKMRLAGKIDRIDESRDEKNRRLYIRIIDYKSSAHDINLDSVIDGKQLQLMVYLDAAMRMEKKASADWEIVPAGTFYFSFDDPIIEITPAAEDAELEDSRISAMKLKGLVNGMTDVIERMDLSLRAPGASLIIPVRRNQNPGELRASDNVINSRQFSLLMSYVRGRMRRAASDILEGQIAPNPTRMDSVTTSCTWCPYSDICRFDPHGGEMSYREPEKRNADERWKLIEEAVSSADGADDRDDRD